MHPPVDLMTFEMGIEHSPNAFLRTALVSSAECLSHRAEARPVGLHMGSSPTDQRRLRRGSSSTDMQ